MEKFTTLNNIKEGASAGNNSFNVNNRTNISNISDSSNDNNVPESKRMMEEMLKKETTINNSLEVQRARLSPSTSQPKTDETTRTLIIKNETDIQSNKKTKYEGNPQLFKNVFDTTLVEDQGRKNNSKENEDTRAAAAPSVESVQKTVISESLSNLLAYGSSSEDSETNSARSSVYQSDIESDLEEMENVNLLKASSSNENNVDDDGGVYCLRTGQETGKNVNKSDDLKMCSSVNDNENAIKNSRKYRENNSSTEEESSESDESSSDETENEGAKSETVTKKVSKKGPHTDGEFGLDDLPPVPDLSKLDINIKEEDCIHMGNITSIVDRLVTIQSLPNTPAYDLDTLLFLDQGKRPLGHVYDVLGQVTSPMYVVRFNSKEEIQSNGVTKGLPVYSAPNTEHTQYVFVKQLMKMKGSDASWKGDNEVPAEFLDFSDDETEYTFNKQSLNEQDIFDNKRKRNSLEKHKMFEVTMNLKNKVDTARHKMRDSYETSQKRYVPQNTQPSFYYPPPPNINHMRQQCGPNFTRFPPPPNFTPAPSFGGFVNMAPMLGLNPFANQFGHVMQPFPPQPQPFPPASYGPPSIPPLPAMPQHVMAAPQPPPPGFANMAVLPPPLPPNTSAMNIPKQPTNIPKILKSPPRVPPNGGVVPKVQNIAHKSRNPGLPKLFIPPQGDYQQYPPNLGLPKANIPPQYTTAPPPPPPNIPVTVPPPFGPPVPPWHYNIPRNPVNLGNFRPVQRHSGNGRQYKKQ